MNLIQRAHPLLFGACCWGMLFSGLLISFHTHAASALQAHIRWVQSETISDPALLTTQQSEDRAIQVLENPTGQGALGVVGRNEGGLFWLVIEDGRPARTNRLGAAEMRAATLAPDGTLTWLKQTLNQPASSGGSPSGLQLVRVAPSGEILWTSDRLRLDESGPVVLKQGAQDTLWVAGIRKSGGDARTDLEVVQYNGQGEIVWTHTQNFASGTLENVSDLTADEQGQPVVIGTFTNSSQTDWFVLKLQNNGKLQWLRFLDGIEAGVISGGPSFDEASKVIMTPRGDIVVAGFSGTLLAPPGAVSLAERFAFSVVGRWNSEGTRQAIQKLPLEAQSTEEVQLVGGVGEEAWLGTTTSSGTTRIATLTHLGAEGGVKGSQQVAWTNRVGWTASTLRRSADGFIHWGGTLWARVRRTVLSSDLVANTALMGFRSDGSLEWSREWTNWPELETATRELSEQRSVLGRLGTNELWVVRQTRPLPEQGWDLEWHRLKNDGTETESGQVDVGAPWARFTNPVHLVPVGSNDVAFLEIETLSTLKSSPPNQVSWRFTRHGSEGQELWTYRSDASSRTISNYDFAEPWLTANGEILIARVVGFGADATLELTKLDALTGALRWTRELGWPNATWAPSLAVNAAGTIAVITGTEEPSNSARVALLSPEGQTLFTQLTLVGQSGRRDPWVGAGSTGGFFVVTSEPDASQTTRVGYLNGAGVVAWNKTITGSTRSDARVVDAAGFLYLTSGQEAAPGEKDWVTRRINAAGDVVSTRSLSKPSVATLIQLSQEGVILLGGEGWVLTGQIQERDALVATGRVRYEDWELTRFSRMYDLTTEWFQTSAAGVSEYRGTYGISRHGFVAVALSGLDRTFTHLLRIDFTPGIVFEAGQTLVHTFGEPGKMHSARRATSVEGPWEKIADVRASVLGDLKVSEPTQSRARAFYLFEPVP